MVGATISLTKRRREFLDQIYRQYRLTNHPVHYSEVAEAIGVSKWTAYDVLKTLENQGLLKRTYSVNENETGRSVVVFTPTELAETFFQKERREILNAKEWQTIVARAREIIENRQNLSLMEAINHTLKLMSDVEVKLEFCTYFLSVLILYLNSLGKQIKGLTVNMVHSSEDPKVQLTVFVGAVVGMIIQTVSNDLSPEMILLVQRFFDNASQLNSEELHHIIGFIKNS